MKRGKHKPAGALRPRYARLAGQLGKTGLVLQGTITQRTIVREDPGAPGSKKAYGPYYQWTWKRHGKTVTVNLTASQARAYQKAIDNHREVQRLIREMRDLSSQIFEATTIGVQKRKARS